MPTFKIELGKQKNDKTAPVYVRVIEKGKPKYYPAKVYVKPSQLKKGLVVHHPDAHLMNAEIEKVRSEVAAKYYGGETKHTNKMTLFKAIDAKLTELEKTNKAPSYNRMLTNKRYIKEALKDNDVALSSLSKVHVEKYVHYRIELGNRQSTIKKNLQDLSGVLEYVEHNGKDEFARYAEKMKVAPATKEKLTPDEIEKFETVKLTGLEDLARDLFLFAYYLHGARLESVLTFEEKYINKKVIKYQMNKGMKYREIDIHPKLNAILKKYKGTGEVYYFPVLTERITSVWDKKDIIGRASAKISKYLKMAVFKAGIDKNVSFHVARHSIAYRAYESGVDVNVIKDALGHSDAKITKNYLKSLSDAQINKAFNKLY